MSTKGHFSPDMPNYTCIHCGPDGRCGLRSPACVRLRPCLSGPSPSLLGQGWHGPRLVERLFDRQALAPRAGHLCYKMPPSLWSGTQLSQPGLAKLLWIALLCCLVSPVAAKTIYLYFLQTFKKASWLLFIFQGIDIFVCITHQLLSRPHNQQ